MSNNPAIHRRPSGDVDIAIPEPDPSIEGMTGQADAKTLTGAGAPEGRSHGTGR